MTNKEAIARLQNLKNERLIAFDDEREINAINTAIEALKKKEREKWHPIDPDNPGSFPDNDRLIMVSFSNVQGAVDISRYRTDEAGGAFYEGDEDFTYVQSGIFVNAWRELPESWEEGK